MRWAIFSFFAFLSLLSAQPLRILILPLTAQGDVGEEEFLGSGMAGMLSDRLSRLIVLPRQQKQDFVFSAAGPVEGELDARPRNVQVEVFDRNQENYLEIYQADRVALARRRGAHFLIDGSFSLSGGREGDRRTLPVRGSVQYSIRAFDALRVRTFQKSYSSSAENTYALADEMARDLSSFLLGANTTSVRLLSEPPGALVYAGESYLGTTPLDRDLLPGRYTLRFQLKGYQDQDLPVLVATEAASFQATLIRAVISTLSVSSDPPGADVFLNMDHLGKTPLKRDDLPVGKHRLRISLQGHVDRFAGVELGTKSESLHFTLTAGDTEEFFKGRDRIILDWNYHDLSFGSLMSAGGFYGAYWYFKVRENRIRESGRALVPTLSIAQIQSLYPLHFYLLQQNEMRAAIMARNANLALSGSGFSFAAAIAFLIAGIRSDERETGEISQLPIKPFYQSTGRDQYFGLSFGF
ncbi:MAG: PEGA domain-containing protein [Spirochaetales bacterium]|nr:PEGA domain-containing protein [Spirochaetales bacterium]